jgi:hypothetical protein
MVTAKDRIFKALAREMEVHLRQAGLVLTQALAILTLQMELVGSLKSQSLLEEFLEA